MNIPNNRLHSHKLKSTFAVQHFQNLLIYLRNQIYCGHWFPEIKTPVTVRSQSNGSIKYRFNFYSVIKKYRAWIWAVQSWPQSFFSVDTNKLVRPSRKLQIKFASQFISAINQKLIQTEYIVSFTFFIQFFFNISFQNEICIFH